MLWLKAFHVIFMVTWFAGLFYLPRLFVYHCEVEDEAGYARLCTMERRLFAISSIGMLLTLILGLALWIGWWPLATGWLHAKAALVAGLVIYHLWMWRTLRHFAARRNRHGAGYYRALNEVPALFLMAIVILAIVKPF